LDILLLKRIAESTIEKRSTEISDTLFAFFVEELNDEELCARLRRFKAEARARVIAEDTAAAQAAVN